MKCESRRSSLLSIRVALGRSPRQSLQLRNVGATASVTSPIFSSAAISPSRNPSVVSEHKGKSNSTMAALGSGGSGSASAGFANGTAITPIPAMAVAQEKKSTAQADCSYFNSARRLARNFEISHGLVLRRIKSCPSTQRINGFESGRRNQPWSRVTGYSTQRPQAQRSRKGFVHRLLGKIKITEQADQSCQDSSRIHAIKGVEQFAYLLGGTLGHDDDRSKPATPNQFGKRRIDAKCPGRDSEIWTTERFLG